MGKRRVAYRGERFRLQSTLWSYIGGIDMKQRTYTLLAVLTFLLSAASLHAQGGCFDSPEAPTAVLMLVGSLGVVQGSGLLRNEIQRRRICRLPNNLSSRSTDVVSVD